MNSNIPHQHIQPLLDNVTLSASPAPDDPGTLSRPGPSAGHARRSSADDSQLPPQHQPQLSPTPSIDISSDINTPLPSPAPRVHVRMPQTGAPKSRGRKQRPSTATAHESFQSRSSLLPAEGEGAAAGGAGGLSGGSDEFGEPVHQPPRQASAEESAAAARFEGMASSASWPLISGGPKEGSSSVSPGENGRLNRAGDGSFPFSGESGDAPVAAPKPPGSLSASSTYHDLHSSPSRPSSSSGDGVQADWRTFVQAYSQGRWDSNRTPYQPVSASFPGASQPAPVSAPNTYFGFGIGHGQPPTTGAGNPYSHIRRSVSSGPPPVSQFSSELARNVSALQGLSVKDSSPLSLASGSASGSSVSNPSSIATVSTAPTSNPPTLGAAYTSPKTSPTPASLVAALTGELVAAASSQAIPIPQAPGPSLAERRGAVAPDLSSVSSVGMQAAFSRPGSEPSSAVSPGPSSGMRLSFSGNRPPQTPGSPAVTPIPSPSLEAIAATATVRWAGARVDVAPLSLPSPEHELVDPLRGFSVSIPGTHDQPSPGTRSSVLPRVAPKGSFWEGMQDVYTKDGQRLPNPPVPEPYTGSAAYRSLETIAGSPLGTPEEKSTGSGEGTEQGTAQPTTPSASTTSTSAAGVSYFSRPPRRTTLPAASAPIPHSQAHEALGDYFSEARVPLHVNSRLRHAISPAASSEGTPSPAVSFPSEGGLAQHHGAPTGSTGAGPSLLSAPATGVTVPGLQRRVTDPEKRLLEQQQQQNTEGPAYTVPRHPMHSDGTIAPTAYPGFPMSGLPLLDRRTKEEREYTALGFLVPPLPPDEEERRKALYRFNVMHTAPDVNFDRIAHLAKLVFKSKVVYISLVDASEQWLKAESGMGVPSVARDISLCGHCILQQGEEPMVVLDASKDWRFQKNPLVVSHPHVRFYAGAPLRTHEGYNIGSLALIDDVPWSEFTPRQRHTLKEFAAIVMRELELWRDKIQLRIRDRIQTSMEHFTRECLEMDVNDGESMNKVYDRAAKLVKRTLDVEGALVIDISHMDMVEVVDESGKTHILYHGDPYGPANAVPQSPPLSPGSSHKNTIYHRNHEFGSIPSLPVLGVSENGSGAPQRARPLSASEHAKLSDFLVNFPDGKTYEGLVPRCFRHMLPNNIQYAMIVPVWSIDKNCFVLLLAYTTDRSKHYLEGYELQYLRAIGVIILSSMLKRRMILADKAKSHFISNISHELRTPLHGILAAAELLGDTRLSGTQSSFLHTVQACATSLVETVNHVLDFTKLSGSKGAQPAEQNIRREPIDLVTLIEETAENCIIGQHARALGEIGSVYAASSLGGAELEATRGKWMRVETVVDISLRRQGWNVLVEKGGIRRVLTNLVGNSLKFTSDGYVQMSLREVPDSTHPGMIRVELAVIDTGKGISKDFLKNQLFHPFSQENPMQSGTGLGLAIVNSIVRSESVNGKVDVYSKEGEGTEIFVSFDAELVPPEDSRPPDSVTVGLDVLGSASVLLMGFDPNHRGQVLQRDVLLRYLHEWWDFADPLDGEPGDILIINEDIDLLRDLVKNRDVSRPTIVLSSVRGDQKLNAVLEAYERMGGFASIVFKPGGPSRILKALKLCLNEMDLRRRGTNVGRSVSETIVPGREIGFADRVDGFGAPTVGFAPLRIRPPVTIARPTFTRSRTDSGDIRFESRDTSQLLRPETSMSNEETSSRTNFQQRTEGTVDSPGSPDSVVEIGDGGVIKRSIASPVAKFGRKARVLVIEDNPINRRLLGSYLSKRGHEYLEAFDGQDGVERFDSSPSWYFDIVLVDMSMPRLDGCDTTAEIRKIELSRKTARADEEGQPSTIFALTGLATSDDKRRAFNAGVDGYLVKPVSLKSLDEVFSNLGFA